MAKDQTVFNVLINSLESEIKSVTTVNLHNLELTSDEIRTFIKLLPSNSQITWLSFSNNTLHDDNAIILAEALKSLEELTYLNLHNTSLSMTSLKNLTKSLKDSTIQTLTLSVCKLGDDGAQIIVDAFNTHPTLLNLGLNRCSLGDSGVTKIATLLDNNFVIKSIDLSMNYLSLEGLKVIERSVKSHPSLTNLSLWGNCNMRFAAEPIFDPKKYDIESFSSGPTVINPQPTPPNLLQWMYIGGLRLRGKSEQAAQYYKDITKLPSQIDTTQEPDAAVIKLHVRC